MRHLAVQTLVDETVGGDVVVVGGGIAGLTAALGLAPRRVTLLSKTTLDRGSASSWAQGGVAAAIAEDDSPSAHAEDTLDAAAGLAELDAVDVLTREGPERVRELIELGARFDRDADGHLALGREGAHSRRRILHARGDATGAEMVRALVAAVRRTLEITVHEGVFATDLVVDDGGAVCGVVARHGDGLGNGGTTRTVYHRAGAVVLATGGFGQLYAYTTNPKAATGDGLVMAARAGAELADLELVQFHPTALLVDEDPLPLVTEALRGEGATLWNDLGERFMLAVDEKAELAPRDIVARAIYRQLRAGRRVLLDATTCLGDAFPRRFPTVYDHCRRHGLDPRRAPIPVTPAAHYAMGGLVTDLWGRTSLDGLWACGEVASTGVHGANRLASNSLLEGLVFGARVAEDVASRGPHRIYGGGGVWREAPGTGVGPGLAVDASDVRRLMWESVGLERDRAGLEAALEALADLGAHLGETPEETKNLVALGRMVAAAALLREESRGAHFRTDFPATAPTARRQHVLYRPDGVLPVTLLDEPASREIARREIA